MQLQVILCIQEYPDALCFSLPDDTAVQNRLAAVIRRCRDAYDGRVKLTIQPPYKTRTTGKGSQNSHIWGHIQQICEETGNDTADVEAYVKERAIRRGYPYTVGLLSGKVIPESTTRIDTIQAGYLIDELHQLAAELHITLKED